MGTCTSHKRIQKTFMTQTFHTLKIHTHAHYQVLDNNNKVQAKRPSEVQLLKKSSTAVALDSEQSTIGQQDVVKVADGPHKGKTGTVRHVFRSFLFLYSSARYCMCKYSYVHAGMHACYVCFRSFLFLYSSARYCMCKYFYVYVGMHACYVRRTYCSGMCAKRMILNACLFCMRSRHTYIHTHIHK